MGGDPARLCSARDQHALQACLADPRPSTVVISGTIRLDGPVDVSGNKTVAGGTLVARSSRALVLRDVANVVVQDVNLVNEPGAERCSHEVIPRDTLGCGVLALVLGRSRDIWINHVSFDRCGEKCIEIFTAKNEGEARWPAPDRITISNSRFTNSYFGVGVGVGAYVPEARMPENERVTVYGNLFDHVFRRSVRAASGAKVHEFNNVVRFWSRVGTTNCGGENAGFGPSSNGAAELLLENNVFDPAGGPCRDPLSLTEYSSRDGTVERGLGLVSAKGNVGLADMRNADVFTPPYAYVLLSADATRLAVPDQAGARSGSPLQRVQN